MLSGDHLVFLWLCFHFHIWSPPHLISWHLFYRVPVLGSSMAACLILPWIISRPRYILIRHSFLPDMSSSVIFLIVLGRSPSLDLYSFDCFSYSSWWCLVMFLSCHSFASSLSFILFIFIISFLYIWGHYIAITQMISPELLIIFFHFPVLPIFLYFPIFSPLTLFGR